MRKKGKEKSLGGKKKRIRFQALFSVTAGQKKEKQKGRA